MNYAKIIIKSNYEKRGDLVLRSYIRALIKARVNELLDAGTDIDDYKEPYLNNMNRAYIYGIVDNEGAFHEIFTGRIIDCDYQMIDINDFRNLASLKEDRQALIKKVIEKVLFKQENDLDINPSSMEELAFDRGVEFVAYDRCLSPINPYRLKEDLYDGYNNFLYKINEIMKIKEYDNGIDDKKSMGREYIKK